MNTKQVLSAVPVTVWLVGGGVIALYLLGRRALEQLGGAGGAGGIGKAIGAGAASLVTGTVEGLAQGAGGVAAAVIRSPSQIVNSTVSSLTGRDESLGTWLYGVFNDEAEQERQREELYRLEIARRQVAANPSSGPSTRYSRGGS